MRRRSFFKIVGPIAAGGLVIDAKPCILKKEDICRNNNQLDKSINELKGYGAYIEIPVSVIFNTDLFTKKIHKLRYSN